mmetsp:Transcript_5249/g.12366  ORF Transcript_5249/g.12366 Transcript_5249/m.12366 type:complete len:226 (+) Transcript_5249:1129-1806(+)
MEVEVGDVHAIALSHVPLLDAHVYPGPLKCLPYGPLVKPHEPPLDEPLQSVVAQHVQTLLLRDHQHNAFGHCEEECPFGHLQRVEWEGFEAVDVRVPVGIEETCLDSLDVVQTQLFEEHEHPGGPFVVLEVPPRVAHGHVPKHCQVVHELIKGHLGLEPVVLILRQHRSDRLPRSFQLHFGKPDGRPEHVKVPGKVQYLPEAHVPLVQVNWGEEGPRRVAQSFLD